MRKAGNPNRDSVVFIVECAFGRILHESLYHVDDRMFVALPIPCDRDLDFLWTEFKYLTPSNLSEVDDDPACLRHPDGGLLVLIEEECLDAKCVRGVGGKEGRELLSHLVEAGNELIIPVGGDA